MPLVRKVVSTPAIDASDGAAAVRALEDGSAEERWAAARLVAGMTAGDGLLARALQREQDKRVREAMLTGLATIKSDQSFECLFSLLRSGDAPVRTGALDALRITGPAIGRHLPRLLSDPDADVRLLACELARNLPAAEGATLLCACLESENEVNVCASAVEVLAEVGDAAALPTLMRCRERFAQVPFLEFSIRLAVERIRAQPPSAT